MIEGGYSHSVSFDAAHIYNRTKPFLFVGNNKIADAKSAHNIKVSHTISYSASCILDGRRGPHPFAAPITSATHLKRGDLRFFVERCVTFNVYIVYLFAVENL